MVKIDLRPSGVALHFIKHKANTSDINGLQRHNERQPGGRHGNKNIDDTRTKDNIFLIEDDRKLNKRVEDTIVENRNGGLKGVRQNAVRMVEGTVQLSGKVLDQPEEKQIELLKDSFEYLQDTFGKENFVSAVIHLDETTPHLHFDFVPIEDGRLTAKTIISPNRLRKYQADFLKHLQDNYSDLNFQRGTGETNELTFEAFKRLKDEKARIEKEQDARDDELDKREEELNNREDKVEKTESEQAEKSKNLDKRDSDITQREAKVVENIQIALDGVDDEVARRVAEATAERVKELDKREHDVEGREKAVEGREKAVDDREKGLDDEVAQRTAERFAEATGMMTEAKRLKREADEKDKKADKKLSDAETKEESANKLLDSFNNVKERFEQRWNSILEAVRKGALRPDPLENFAKRHEHVKVDDGIDINKMAEDFENQLKALGNNDNQINL